MADIINDSDVDDFLDDLDFLDDVEKSNNEENPIRDLSSQNSQEIQPGVLLPVNLITNKPSVETNNVTPNTSQLPHETNGAPPEKITWSPNQQTEFKELPPAELPSKLKTLFIIPPNDIIQVPTADIPLIETSHVKDLSEVIVPLQIPPNIPQAVLDSNDVTLFARSVLAAIAQIKLQNESTAADNTCQENSYESGEVFSSGSNRNGKVMRKHGKKERNSHNAAKIKHKDRSLASRERKKKKNVAYEMYRKENGVERFKAKQEKRLRRFLRREHSNDLRNKLLTNKHLFTNRSDKRGSQYSYDAYPEVSTSSDTWSPERQRRTRGYLKQLEAFRRRSLSNLPAASDLESISENSFCNRSTLESDREAENLVSIKVEVNDNDKDCPEMSQRKKRKAHREELLLLKRKKAEALLGTGTGNFVMNSDKQSKESSKTNIKPVLIDNLIISSKRPKLKKKNKNKKKNKMPKMSDSDILLLANTMKSNETNQELLELNPKSECADFSVNSPLNLRSLSSFTEINGRSDHDLFDILLRRDSGTADDAPDSPLSISSVKTVKRCSSNKSIDLKKEVQEKPSEIQNMKPDDDPLSILDYTESSSTFDTINSPVPEWQSKMKKFSLSAAVADSSTSPLGRRPSTSLSILLSSSPSKRSSLSPFSLRQTSSPVSDALRSKSRNKSKTPVETRSCLSANRSSSSPSQIIMSNLSLKKKNSTKHKMRSLSTSKSASKSSSPAGGAATIAVIPSRTVSRTGSNRTASRLSRKSLRSPSRRLKERSRSMSSNAVMSHRNKNRSISPRSRSRRSRSQSTSGSRNRRSRSRSHSKTGTMNRRSRSLSQSDKSRSLLRNGKSRSHSRNRKSRSLSRKRRSRTRSLSRNRESRSLSRNRKSRSLSRKRKSGMLSRKRKSRTRSLSRNRESRSLSRNRRSKSLSRNRRSRSRSRNRRSRSRSRKKRSWSRSRSRRSGSRSRNRRSRSRKRHSRLRMPYSRNKRSRSSSRSRRSISSSRNRRSQPRHRSLSPNKLASVHRRSASSRSRDSRTPPKRSKLLLLWRNKKDPYWRTKLKKKKKNIRIRESQEKRLVALTNLALPSAPSTTLVMSTATRIIPAASVSQATSLALIPPGTMNEIPINQTTYYAPGTDQPLPPGVSELYPTQSTSYTMTSSVQYYHQHLQYNGHQPSHPAYSPAFPSQVDSANPMFPAIQYPYPHIPHVPPIMHPLHQHNLGLHNQHSLPIPHGVSNQHVSPIIHAPPVVYRPSAQGTLPGRLVLPPQKISNLIPTVINPFENPEQTPQCVRKASTVAVSVTGSTNQANISGKIKNVMNISNKPNIVENISTLESHPVEDITIDGKSDTTSKSSRLISRLKQHLGAQVVANEITAVEKVSTFVESGATTVGDAVSDGRDLSTHTSDVIGIPPSSEKKSNISKKIEINLLWNKHKGINTKLTSKVPSDTSSDSTQQQVVPVLINRVASLQSAVPMTPLKAVTSQQNVVQVTQRQVVPVLMNRVASPHCSVPMPPLKELASQQNVVSIPRHFSSKPTGSINPTNLNSIEQSELIDRYRKDVTSSTLPKAILFDESQGQLDLFGKNVLYDVSHDSSVVSSKPNQVCSSSFSAPECSVQNIPVNVNRLEENASILNHSSEIILEYLRKIISVRKRTTSTQVDLVGNSLQGTEEVFQIDTNVDNEQLLEHIAKILK